MKWLIENSRYLAVIAVFGMILGAIASLFLGVVKTFELLKATVFDYGASEKMFYILFEALDCFLVALALIVIAVSLYELFIGVLDVPDWMFVKDLTELKAKFTFVIIPVMAVKFLQKILKAENALDTLYFGVAVAVVTLTLTYFSLVSGKDKTAKKIE